VASAGEFDGYDRPIAEHGLVGDLHTVALVGTDGTIDWYCCPAFDAPSVFGAILDRENGGFYALHPSTPEWSSKQLYFPDTNVLITRFFTPDGVAEIEDFMPIETADAAHHRHRLVRRVVVVRGTMPFTLEVQPRFDYAREAHEVVLQEQGVVFRSPTLTLALEGSWFGNGSTPERPARGCTRRSSCEPASRARSCSSGSPTATSAAPIPNARRRRHSMRRCATGARGWVARAIAGAGVRRSTAPR
jgi:hypothetical protein